MKKTLLFAAILVLNFLGAQKTKDKNGGKIVSKYEATQPHDFSVPPPPITTFPAYFPTGNKDFLNMVTANISEDYFKNVDHNLETQIILKIDVTGNVLHISVYGSDDRFNDHVKAAVKKTTENIKWEPAKNREGKNVIDIVRIPFRLKSTSTKTK
ncbi:hypothetical protein [Kaistella polysaccharea]|uniref:hypothetical protein n=1 Tax=Kaistella polysaccharea TaxID=2878534 RepID=UPI001CF1AAA0|nr:hypothetical protein [Kaistella polysaccharea]